jgi:uridylate kinase
MKPAYKRVLFKISGEALSGDSSSGIDKAACAHIVASIKSIQQLGVQVGIVVGGGNFFRGALAQEFNLSRVPADHIGMLATAMNGIFLAEAIARVSLKAYVMGAKDYGGSVELFSAHKAKEYLNGGAVVIFTGGTGNPYFTTDTAAALRACEIEAGALFKATKVDGIYNKDPMKYVDAKKYETLSYQQALSENLKVMDAAALALCRDAGVPIFVFNLFAEDAFVQAVCHLKGGTKVV